MWRLKRPNIFTLQRGTGDLSWPPFFVFIYFSCLFPGPPSGLVKTQTNPDSCRFGWKHFGCHDSCTISGRPRDEKSVGKRNAQQCTRSHFTSITCDTSKLFTNMAEKTSNSVITEEDPFNEDEVRWEFGAIRKADMLKVWESLSFHLLDFTTGNSCIFVFWNEIILLKILQGI